MTVPAFMGTPIKLEQEVEDKHIPTFKPRWWYSRDALDLRPVIWSLENHPEEWRWDRETSRLIHIPSKHEFADHTWSYIGGTLRSSAGCSCISSRHEYQIGHRAALVKAMRAFAEKRTPAVNDQFRSHFVH